MKGLSQIVLLLVALVTITTSCQQKTKKEVSKEQFVLNGTIKGMTTGKVLLEDNAKNLRDTINVVDGKFQITGNYPEPKFISVRVLLPQFNIEQVFAENTNFTFTADIENPRDTKVIGGKAQADKNLFDQWYAELFQSSGMNSYYSERRKGDLSEEREAELEKIRTNFKDAVKELKLKFIKEHPDSHYSLTIVSGLFMGATPEQMEIYLSYLSPSLESTSDYNRLKAKMENVKQTHGDLKDFVKSASNVNYKVEESFAGKEYTNVVYLAKLKNDNVCALKKDGTVLIINAKGNKISEFKATVKGNATAIAVDDKDQIYVLDTQQKMVKKKIRGREIQMAKPVGVICTVYSSDGKLIREFACTRNITAAGAKLIDGKLIVSDSKNAQVVFYDASRGELITRLGGMRPCCGMLDFALTNEKQLLVANLGAFRVQCVDMKGKKLMDFGSRGKSIDEFHGCCNPVSVASLNNGAIVTVEKESTRVKIYSSDGAKQIQGIEELVKGCSYIPMTVDSKDNLYLASAEKGIMKCVAIN